MKFRRLWMMHERLPTRQQLPPRISNKRARPQMDLSSQIASLSDRRSLTYCAGSKRRIRRSNVCPVVCCFVLVLWLPNVVAQVQRNIRNDVGQPERKLPEILQNAEVSTWQGFDTNEPRTAYAVSHKGNARALKKKKSRYYGKGKGKGRNKGPYYGIGAKGYYTSKGKGKGAYYYPPNLRPPNRHPHPHPKRPNPHPQPHPYPHPPATPPHTHPQPQPHPHPHPPAFPPHTHPQPHPHPHPPATPPHTHPQPHPHPPATPPHPHPHPPPTPTPAPNPNPSTPTPGGSTRDGCRVELVVEFLQLAALPPPLYNDPNVRNAQTIGTRYIYNDAIYNQTTTDEISNSRVSGVCTRTNTRVVNDVVGIQPGGGYCQFTYTLYDGNDMFTFNAVGEVRDTEGGVLPITGGAQGMVGAYGEIELIPVQIDSNGEFVPVEGDFFLDPLVYLADAVIFLPCENIA